MPRFPFTVVNPQLSKAAQEAALPLQVLTAAAAMHIQPAPPPASVVAVLPSVQELVQIPTAMQEPAQRFPPSAAQEPALPPQALTATAAMRI